MDNSIKKNYLYSVMYQFLVMILPMITIPYVSRIFGAENIGVYSYTNTIAQYYVIFAMLGLNNYGNREIAAIRDNKEKLNNVFSEIYTMQIFTGLISLLAYIIYAVFISQEYRIYSLILSLYVLSAIFDVNWLFFGLEKFRLTVTRNSIIKIFSVIAIFLLVDSIEDLWIYTGIYAVSNLISTIILWPYVKKEVIYKTPRFSNVCKHIGPNMWMFMPVMAISIYKYMDKIMLGYCSKTEVGYYENVEKLISVALGFIVAFGNVMLPRISNMVANCEVKQIKKSLIVSMRFVLGLSFAVTFGLAAISPEFIGVYFGQGFEPCILIMTFLAPTMIFQSWATVIRTQYLIPFKHDKIYVSSVVVCAVINFVINCLLIPRLGALGAVIGTIVAEAGVAIIQTIAVRKDVDCLVYMKQGMPFFFFGIFMYSIIRMLSSISNRVELNIAVEILVGSVVYLMLWFIYERKAKQWLYKF